MAPHSSTLAWKIPWTEEPGRLQSMGSLRSDTTEQLHFHFSLSCIGEGNGNPLQCSCLENRRDGGAWWAAIYGVTQSWTWLKRLSSNRAYIANNKYWSLGAELVAGKGIVEMTLFCSFLWLEYYSIVCILLPCLLYPFRCWWTFRLLPCLGYLQIVPQWTYWVK